MTTGVLDAKFATMMNDISFKLGEMSAISKMFEENWHTCELKAYRHPWPLDPNCKACCIRMDKFVNEFYLHGAVIFGWDILIDRIDNNLHQIYERAEARRNAGDYI